MVRVILNLCECQYILAGRIFFLMAAPVKNLKGHTCTFFFVICATRLWGTALGKWDHPRVGNQFIRDIVMMIYKSCAKHMIVSCGRVNGGARQQYFHYIHVPPFSG